MAILKIEELRGMDASTLAGRLRDLKAELSSEHGVIAAGGRPGNPGRIRELRRTIARIHTVACQRKIDLAAEEEKLSPLPPVDKEAGKPKAKKEAPAKEEKRKAGREEKPAEKKK